MKKILLSFCCLSALYTLTAHADTPAPIDTTQCNNVSSLEQLTVEGKGFASEYFREYLIVQDDLKMQPFNAEKTTQDVHNMLVFGEKLAADQGIAKYCYNAK